jgi:integrase
LRCGDIDLESARLVVRPELQKTRCGQPFVLSDQTLPLVRQSVTMIQRDRLFPWDRNSIYIYHHFKKQLKLAGLPSGRVSMFHRIRKTSASMIEATVGDGAATKWLGHTKRSVTEDYYLDPALLPNTNLTASLPRPALRKSP